MQKIQKYSLNRSKKEKILGGGRVYHSDFVEISEYRGLVNESVFFVFERNFQGNGI